MKTTAVRYFRCPIWIILVNDKTTLKLNPPEELAESPNPIVLALLQWDGENGPTGHYQSVQPEPCDTCHKIWSSKKCTHLAKSLCQGCNCKCNDDLLSTMDGDSNGRKELPTTYNIEEEEGCVTKKNTKSDEELEEEEIVGSAEIEIIKKELEYQKSTTNRLKDEINLVRNEASKIISDKDREIRLLKESVELLKEKLAKQQSENPNSQMLEDENTIQENIPAQPLESESSNTQALEDESTIEGNSPPQTLDVQKIEAPIPVPELENTIEGNSPPQPLDGQKIVAPIPVPVRRSLRTPGGILKREYVEMILKKMEEKNDQAHGLELDNTIANKGRGIRVSIIIIIFVYDIDIPVSGFKRFQEKQLHCRILWRAYQEDCCRIEGRRV